MTPQFDNDLINKNYKDHCNKFEHDHKEYVLKLNKPCIIEPQYAYTIIDFNKIIAKSVFYPELIPSVYKYLKNKIFKKKYLYFESAFIFDGDISSNYFHFYSDVINKIWLLDKYNIDKNIALIIGNKTFNSGYFQYLYKNSILKNYNWIIQNKGEIIKSKITYIARPMPYEVILWKKTLSLYNIQKNNSQNYSRVFLNRSIKAGRYISNFQELEPIIKKYNFQIVDTDSLSSEEQIKIFSNMKYLVSPHGAAETNIIFAYQNNPALLEIMPQGRISCQYYWLANTFGFYYDVVLGSCMTLNEKNIQGSYTVSKDLLEKAIVKMLNYESVSGQ
ncbi:MAG: glycosyltransferase family 61 protein [Bacteroidetes bacterium]|nr:glycosyltransferase family 61 protein [Bacteroidota bacterium]